MIWIWGDAFAPLPIPVLSHLRVMPLYEYRCRECDKKFTFLYGVVANNTDPRCPRCGSDHLKKLISRVQRLRAEEEALEDMVDPMKIGDLEDPGNLRKWARKMGKELGAETGEDLSEELEQMIEAEARGELDEEGAASEDSTIY